MPEHTPSRRAGRHALLSLAGAALVIGAVAACASPDVPVVQASATPLGTQLPQPRRRRLQTRGST
ncbi:hypothetical protein NKG05_09075 [Oerskovia sp. M15]